MKRIASLLLAALLLAGTLAACGKEAEEPEPLVGGESNGLVLDETGTHIDPQLDKDGKVIEIREKLFIAQTNEIYLNYEDYLGKTIRYEGIYVSTQMEGADPQYWAVRWGPGCCANDGSAGFELAYDGEYPEENDWVAVEGVLSTYDINGWEMLILQVSSIEVKEERGKEYVTT